MTIVDRAIYNLKGNQNTAYTHRHRISTATILVQEQKTSAAIAELDFEPNCIVAHLWAIFIFSIFAIQ